MALRTCRKCGCLLVAGDNWSVGLVTSRTYLCRPCNSAKGKAHYRENAVRALELQRARMASPAKQKEASDYKNAYYAANKEKWESYRLTQKERQETHFWPRAGRMTTWIRSRAAKRGFDFDLTPEWVEERLTRGVCEITGIRFDLSRTEGERFNPFGPSVDRIDNGRGYTQDNCRVVVWIYNMAKSEWSDDVVMEFAKALVSR